MACRWLSFHLHEWMCNGKREKKREKRQDCALIVFFNHNQLFLQISTLTCECACGRDRRGHRTSFYEMETRSYKEISGFQLRPQQTSHLYRKHAYILIHILIHKSSHRSNMTYMYDKYVSVIYTSILLPLATFQCFKVITIIYLKIIIYIVLETERQLKGLECMHVYVLGLRFNFWHCVSFPFHPDLPPSRCSPCYPKHCQPQSLWASHTLSLARLYCGALKLIRYSQAIHIAKSVSSVTRAC